MDFDEAFDTLSKSSDKEARRNFTSFFHDTARAVREDDVAPVDAAYAITGMLSTPFARSLEPGDLLLDVMTIAGELEIDPPDAEALTAELLEAIDLLL